VVAGGGQEALIGGYAQAVHLGIWMLNGARADAGKGLPEPAPVMLAAGEESGSAQSCEPDCVVIAGYHRVSLVAARQETRVAHQCKE
jgi:hypothetical protein